MSDYLGSISYTVANQRGCCGIGTIARLGGTTICERRRLDSYEAWKKTNPTQSLVRTNTDLPLTALLNIACTRTHKVVLPTIDEAFASVWDHCTGHGKHAIYFCSDNMSGEGDVHTGPFSTRAFVKWSVDNNLGCMQTTGPITSRRTGHYIQGWMFIPNWEVIDQTIGRARESFIKRAKEIQYEASGTVKGSIQDGCHQRARDDRELQDQWDREWSEGAAIGQG